MTAILQTSLPYDLSARALPGIQPLPPDGWLTRDEAFAAQMARRDQLLRARPQAVLAMDPAALPAAQELLAEVLALAYPGAGDTVQRPDGVRVRLDWDQPMRTLGHLVQEDLCLLQKRGDEHVLTAAVLCFPASWRLSEKFMQPLTGIHVPVASYDAQIAKRVQRLFDGVQVGRPLWRFNALWYDDPELFQPRSVQAPRPEMPRDQAAYLRSEKQAILRLPRCRDVVFSIHSYVLDRAHAAVALKRSAV